MVEKKNKMAKTGEKNLGKIRRWNEWPIWVKWGIIFSLLDLIFWIGISIFNFIFTFFYFDKIQFNLSMIYNNLTFLLPAFLIGALIGWIVGKIKSNQLNDRQIK